MSLPVLTTAKYTLKLPSTGEVIEFRPYLVKEEKLLMIAQESGDSEQMIKAIMDLVKSCTFGQADPKDICLFDLEYIFLKIRAKSVGEISTVTLQCEKEECKAKTEVDINLDEIEVEFPQETSDTIQLTDTIGIKMNYAKVSRLLEVSRDIKNDVEAFISLAISCIEHIYDDEKIYKAEESSIKELNEFIDSLDRKQFNSLQEYVLNMPRLQKEVTFKCIKCGHEQTVLIEGLQNFFE